MNYTTCSLGYYCPSTSQQIACSSGYYCAAKSTAQTNCPAGYFCTTGSTKVACLSGNSCPEGSSINITCSAGKYCPNSTVEIECPLGYYQSSSGQLQCDPCPVDTYCDATGLTAYTTCPSNSETGATAATDISECICISGYEGLLTSSSSICYAAANQVNSSIFATMAVALVVFVVGVYFLVTSKFGATMLQWILQERVEKIFTILAQFFDLVTDYAAYFVIYYSEPSLSSFSVPIIVVLSASSLLFIWALRVNARVLSGKSLLKDLTDAQRWTYLFNSVYAHGTTFYPTVAARYPNLHKKKSKDWQWTALVLTNRYISIIHECNNSTCINNVFFNSY